MVRRYLDKVPGQMRGQEELGNPIWKGRVNELISVLKKTPMTADDITGYMNRSRQWPILYGTNVLAAADIEGLLGFSDGKWYVI